MENFIAYNPTKVHFGRNVINDLAKTIIQYGKKVLFIFGKGSIYKNGIFDIIANECRAAGVELYEYSGIKPNPVTTDAEKAVQLGVNKKVDVILAVGGGSVIDTAKIVSVCIDGKLNPWDVMRKKIEPKSAVPLIAVLTLAATGTEMNSGAVLQNPETKKKIGFGSDLIFPRHSFLDPTYTFSVPADQTSYGVTDLIAHALEGFFGDGNAPLTDDFVVSIIKNAMHFGPLVLKEPENYEYRANIMWSATCALNGMTAYGRKSGDWGVHTLGHILSVLFDTPHGATLSIAYPAWMKHMKDRAGHRIKALGEALFNTDSMDKTILELEHFFQKINSPVHLSEIGIPKESKGEIIELMTKNKCSGIHYKLGIEDYQRIVDFMY